jgi:hypothetical protein
MNIHNEQDWKNFFESLQFASVRLNRSKAVCIIPDIIFLEKSATSSLLTWYSQQQTTKGEGVYKVSASHTSPRTIIARLEKHVLETFGHTITPQSQKYAAVGMWNDRIELLTFGDVTKILFEVTSSHSIQRNRE